MSDPTPPPGWGQPPQTPPPPPGQGYGPPGQGFPPQPGQGFSPPQAPPSQAYPPQGYPPQGPPQQGYQPQGQPTPPKKSRTGLIVLAAVLVVGGIIAAAVLVLLAGDDTPVVSEETPVDGANDQQSNELDGSTTDQPDPDPTATDAALPDAAIDLQVGDCYNGASTSDEVANVEIVPCDTPHEAEVFLVTSFPDDGPFPGAGALDEFAADVCKGQAFDDYVGLAWAESRYFTSQLLPTEESWERGHRDITCSLYDIQAPLQSSARGSGQ